MKKSLLLICAAFALSSCIDRDYDLADVNTDDTSLGGDDSEFRMPLANLKITMDQVSQGDSDIESIFAEADVWLPSPLPGGAKSVDLRAMKDNPAYRESLINALIVQMENQTVKLNLVTDFIWDNYRQNFVSLLSQTPGVDLTNPVHFKSVFKEDFMNPNDDQIKQETASVARNYLTDLDVDPIMYVVSPIDISSDIVNMIVDNIDPADVVNPKNTLHLCGQVVSDLPIGMRLEFDFISTSVGFDVDLNPDIEIKIPQTRLFASDIRTIVAGMNINVPITLLEYFPDRRFDPKQKITLTLSLLKRGGLAIKL